MGQEYKEKLNELNLPGDTPVTLTYSDGCEVFHYKDDAVNDAVSETDVVRRFCDLVVSLGGSHMEDVCAALAEYDALELPDPDDEDAEPISARTLRIAIKNGFYDQEFIGHSIKRYDNKRGYCTLTAALEVTVDELLAADLDLSGWTLEMKTAGGNISISG